MQIIKMLSNNNSVMTLCITVSIDHEEQQIARRFGFYDFRIKTKDGPFSGRTKTSRNQKGAYRAQLAKVKNRWSSGLVRTTGSVFFDLILSAIGLAVRLAGGLFSFLFGRRHTLKSAMRGITVKSKRIEVLKEAELFVFISLAAISKAFDYAKNSGIETVFDNSSLLDEVQGLDFAGAGGDIESEFDTLNTLIEFSKNHT